MSDEDDPFESMEDREGDPFERLDAPDDAETAGDDADGAGTDDAADLPDAAADDDSGPAFEEEFIEAEDPFTIGGEGSADGATDAGSDESFESDPFGEMDDRDDPFRDMAGGEGDPFGDAESAFEAVEVDALDEEELWASIDSDDTTTVEHKRYSEVSKHRFCEQCEFFAEPPASHCTHEEASILEYLDMEQVRVVNCPIVAEQQRIESEE